LVAAAVSAVAVEEVAVVAAVSAAAVEEVAVAAGVDPAVAAQVAVETTGAGRKVAAAIRGITAVMGILISTILSTSHV